MSGQDIEAQKRLIANKVRELRRQRSAVSERDFTAFFEQAWPVLEPATPLKLNWHHELISEYLEAAYRREIKRLIVNVPPRTGKSNQITVSWPAWVWTKSPEQRFICLSYAAGLATKHSTDRRTLIESPWFQRSWGHKFSMADDNNLKTEFSNDKRGHMISASLHGSSTGRGGDYIIVDDPHNPKRAHSDQMREADLTEFQRTVRNRLDDKERGVIIVVMQRLHEQDLSGHLLGAERDQWTWLRLPAEAPKRVQVRFPTSGRTLVREQGALLQPDRLPRPVLAELKKGMGSYNYAGQYDQAPGPAGGGILKRKWWEYYRALPARMNRRLISIDCAFKDTEDSDMVVIQAWGQSVIKDEGGAGAEFYLIDEVRDQMDFIATIRAFRAFCAKHKEIFEKIVEEKANGAAVISALRKKISGLIAYNPKVSKLERARAVSPLIEAGNVYLPDPEIVNWVSDFVQECAAFPKGQYDDRVDAMSQALLRFTTTEAGSFDGVHARDADNEKTTIVPSKNAEDLW